jgi:hypothetical protein
LDEFEGESYERVLTEVQVAGGRTANAFIYIHRTAEDDPG